MTSLRLPHGELPLPVFLPDATRGVVRTLDSVDLEACGVDALVMSTYHLMQNPGTSTIQALGGVHRMAGWQRSIITDSGGFQIYSLIRQNPKFGSLSNKGATFRIEGGSHKYNLTPEKSIQLQISYGADVVICLDDCTHVDGSLTTQQESVRRTIDWARRSKVEFSRLIAQKNIESDQRPYIFAVIQGGGVHELRKRCAESLLEIGFDGYGFGGWPLDNQGNLLTDILGYTRSLVPEEFPVHALGIAHPANIKICYRLGYNLFDGAMPTRDARHGRLYSDNPAYVYIYDNCHIKSSGPISSNCDCLVCTRYSLGYLHHLFKIGDVLAQRLATIHNLRFITRLVEGLRNGQQA
jgi:queuine tRNA-ribosyltransferase